MPVDPTQSDRRVNRRHELQLPVRFVYTDARGAIHAGCGVTRELSLDAVRFHAENAPPRASLVAARIEWPLKLQNICGLELVVKGAVVANSRRGTVMRMSSYELRTCGARSFFEAQQESTVWRLA